jgi:uncharacterized protein (TIGR00369 family)
MPQAAQTLGFELLDADPERGTIEIAFTASEAWTNPVGNVLGAFVAAMLYDVVGPALLATLEPDEFQATEEIVVRFEHPLRPGRVVGRGRVIDRAGDRAHVAAELVDSDGRSIATCTATTRVIPLAEAPDAV